MHPLPVFIPCTHAPLSPTTFTPLTHILTPPSLRARLCSRSTSLHRPSHGAPRASLLRDFLAGPSTPPRARPLHRVILFSVATGLAWYGYYKFCVEQELRATLGHGPGGYLALGPFLAGVSAPLYVPAGGAAEAAVALGVAWIVGVQYGLYRRINEVCVDAGMGAPLRPAWIALPGFNLVVGLRSVHFLSVALRRREEGDTGGDDDDPVVKWFPFLGAPTLGVWELLTTPALWVNLG